MMKRKKRITLKRLGSCDPRQAILSSKKLSKKEIQIKLKLSLKTEERLRGYVKRQFSMTLEKKLRDVLIQWIGKAIEQMTRIVL